MLCLLYTFLFVWLTSSLLFQTIISGMGELHLEIYLERMKREYGVTTTSGKPQVAYREAPFGSAAYDYTHKKQSGGAGQFARVMGELSPAEDPASNVFVLEVVGGKISDKFLVACERGFADACEKGPLTGHKVVGARMLVNDGQTHVVDLSELAFRTAAAAAFREVFLKSNPSVLEPVVKVVTVAPPEFQGACIGLMNKLGGVISDTETTEEEVVVTAECPLSQMFGFATTLRASTQGKGEFTLEFSHYAPCLPHVQKELIEEYAKSKK